MTGTTVMLGLALAVLCTVCLILIWKQKKTQREIEELTQYLMRLQDQDEVPAPQHQAEGELGILRSEMYKLMIQMKEQFSGALDEKEYLADMLSDISHQIKTPLAAITIMTDLLQTPQLPEEKRLEFTQRIDDSVSRITWLIRNLLTLSQLDANRLKLKKEEAEAGELARQVCAPFEPMLEEKQILLCLRSEEDIIFVCDRRWTAEAISNIVKNCMEHTKSGGEITVAVSQNNFSTNFLIRDNGVGIPKEQLPHIFERFYKGGNESPESVGIGLAMSEKIVTLQNGTIEVRSEEGVGTEFLVKFYR